MNHNLFVAYDLMKVGQDYEAVQNAIKSLGDWYQFQFSLFYVSTPFSADDAHNIVRAVMDANDRLCVIEASQAVVSTYPIPDIQAVNFAWFQGRLKRSA
jgi:hypothetical protein